MAQTINTNVASLNAQRNLNRSQGLLNQSLERLSTGLRINSAKDDAAGLAISERFTTQIRGLDQAVRNASDGISLSQTAESALGELTNNLQRIRELAVQSSNATNSASDRAALNAEVLERIAEVDRIAKQTNFNGVKVLDGSFGTATFQVGANVGETISVSLTTDVTASAIGSVITDEGSGFTMDPADAVTETAVLTITPAGGTAVDVDIAAGSTLQQVADSINGANIGGVSAFVSGNGEIQILSDVEGLTITEALGGTASTGLGAITTAAEAVDATTTLSGVGVDTVANANFAIARIDSALTAVNGLRGNLGAIQNRFESTIINLQTVGENLSAARGRIQDADFAAETAALTKAQILQQAGVSVLAQANAQPQLALSLLQ
ncbi:MAG: flagellin [Gammaproteobacteria bacterium]|nr:flagellin [Gammaproteobacteria bacterium]MDH4313249.1 flagellin [Gammaproteobacteria bacterium]MDH5213545.1 flagellin [Gammaproteobacteria bacterium]